MRRWGDGETRGEQSGLTQLEKLKTQELLINSEVCPVPNPVAELVEAPILSPQNLDAFVKMRKS